MGGYDEHGEEYTDGQCSGLCYVCFSGEGSKSLDIVSVSVSVSGYSYLDTLPYLLHSLMLACWLDCLLACKSTLGRRAY